MTTNLPCWAREILPNKVHDAKNQRYIFIIVDNYYFCSITNKTNRQSN